MLLSSAGQKGTEVFPRVQDENIGEKGGKGSFLGRHTAVSTHAIPGAASSGTESTIIHNKRQVTSTYSLDGAASLLFTDRFRSTLDRDSRYCLNKDHSCLIIERFTNSELHVWLANEDSNFIKRGVITTDLSMLCSAVQHTDILFIPCHAAKHGYFLSVYEWDEIRGFHKTQEISNDDLFVRPCAQAFLTDYVSKIEIANDGKTVALLTDNRGGVILGRGPDGKWENKGRCMQYDKLIFSNDGNHVAMTMEDSLALMSKGSDGVWTKTGEIDRKSGLWKVAFSPDNQHFIAWFNIAGVYCNCSERRDFFVELFALNQDKQWVEKMRITKYSPVSTGYYMLKAKFSPDGKHLVVCGQDKFDIWDLGDDGNWTSAIAEIPYSHGDTMEGLNKPVIKFATNSHKFMVLTKLNGVVWGLQDNGIWGCKHIFPINWELRPQFSADGKAIVCQVPTDDDQRGLWLEDEHGQWGWQAIDFNCQNPLFHPVSKLLAFNGPIRNSLMFMGPSSDEDGGWEEKGRLEFASDVRFFDFSPDGRFLRVHSSEDNCHIELSIWDIVADNSKHEAKRRCFDPCPEMMK